jgi:hypothetical protein
MNSKFDEIFPVSKMVLGPDSWTDLTGNRDSGSNAGDFLTEIKKVENYGLLPDYLPELLELEYTYHKILHSDASIASGPTTFKLNPTLEILQVHWPLADLFNRRIIPEEPGKEWILIWKHPETQKTRVKTAIASELLVCKILSEDSDIQSIVFESELTEADLYRLLWNAARKGFILKPSSKIKRSFRSGHNNS